MGRIKTVTTLLLVLALSVVAIPVNPPPAHALVPSSIQGFIVDTTYEAYTQCIRAPGKVYALEVNTNFSKSVEVTANNGSYRLTELRPGTYQLTASAGLYQFTGYAYANTTLPYQVTVGEGTNLTNVNIPLNRGGKLEGFLRYTHAGSPIRAIEGNPWLKATSITWLNYSVEAYDLNGTLRGEYNSSLRHLTAEDATTSPFTITGTRYAGLEVGTYELKPLVFGYINKTTTLVSLNTLGGSVSSIYINLHSGGVISGTIVFADPAGNPETPKAASDAAGAIFGGNIGVNVFDSSGVLKGAYNHRWIPSTLYAHSETTTLGSETFYLSKYDCAEKTGTNLSVGMDTTGRKLWGKFVYPLIGISSIPAGTWTIYYRAWYSAGGTAHCDVDILIRKSDGTVRTPIATNVANSGALTTTPQTLSGTYSWADYTVVDKEDYLEIDFYCEVIGTGASAYLRIDDHLLALSDQTRAANINPVADDLSTTLRFHVLGFSDFYNETYSGRAYKDYGLADGAYTVRVYVRGYIQPIIGTVTISQGGNSTIRVYMIRGGAIIATVHSMLDETHTQWRYPDNHIRIYAHGIGWVYFGMKQDSSTDRVVMRFNGLDYSISEVQRGMLPLGLSDGTYQLSLHTYGYVQPTDVYAIILTGSKTDVAIYAQLGCTISGKVIFRTQNIPVPLTERMSINVGAFDASGALKGHIESWHESEGFSSSSFSISGHWWYPEYGLDPGNYSLELMWCRGDTIKYMQVEDVTVTLPRLRSSAYVEIIVHEMGRVFGTIKEYDALGNLVPVKDVRVNTTSEGTTIAYTSGADGNYTLNLPVNRTNVNQPIAYNVTFSKYYFINQTIPVETYSGAQTYLNIVLEEIPEFPLGVTITLTLAYFLIVGVFSRVKKRAKQIEMFSKKDPS